MAFLNVATLLAESLSLDGITGRLSVFNMLEAVLAPAFPAALGKLVVVNVYEVEGEREPYWERVRVVDVVVVGVISAGVSEALVRVLEEEMLPATGGRLAAFCAPGTLFPVLTPLLAGTGMGDLVVVLHEAHRVDERAKIARNAADGVGLGRFLAAAPDAAALEAVVGAIGTEEFGPTVRDSVMSVTAGARRIYLFEATGREHTSLQSPW